MKLREFKKNLSILIFISLILFCFSGCSSRAEQKSLTGQFDVIDALILQNQMPSALKELKKTEKRVFDSWSYIGLYKRYQMLGESALAEKLLKKAIKKNGSNQELLAVYAGFLLREGRLDEAGKVAEKLRGGKYASLYSEYILRNAAGKSHEDAYHYYQSKEFYQIYLDAYEVSKNPVWLRNCAVFNLTNGSYSLAADLLPPAYVDADDAFFWAMVTYDAGRYYDTIDALEDSRNLMSGYENQKMFKTSKIQLIALESDAYMAVSEMESAENSRREVILNLDDFKVKPSEEELLTNVILNSAIWAGNQGLDYQSADLLFYVVNRWPDCVPALVLYADFAYRSNLEREEDSELTALRRAGIRTLEMEKYDNRRKIPMSDAIYRIDASLARQADPFLEIARLDLKYKTDTTISEKDKNRDLWYMLENNINKDGEYQMLLVQYALNFLLRTKQYDDAWNLFQTFVLDKKKFDSKRDFWEQFIENIHDYDLPIVEFGSWFATYFKKADEAVRLSEYCVYESGGILEDGFISQKASTAVGMNLGDIYFSIGKKSAALELYGKLAGRESRNSKRSEIFYRIANIYAAEGDIKNALRSAEYSSSLYPENARASILKDKLKLKTIQSQQ